MGCKDPAEGLSRSGPPRVESKETRWIAPAWHTALLVALVLSVAVTGTLLRLTGSSTLELDERDSRIAMRYLPAIVSEWALVGYVCRIGRSRNALSWLLGRGQIAASLVLAVALSLVVGLVEHTFARVTGMTSNGAVDAILPRTLDERLLWIPFAVSAGFCEEVVYRGYLRVQVQAFTGSGALAQTAQALLFGIAHAEQGAASAVRLAAYGLLFGIVAARSGTLLPTVLAHAGIDLTTGLLP